MRSLPWLLAASILGCACARTDREQAAITVDTLVTFGDAEGPGALASAPRNVVVDSRGRYWAAHRNALSVFDSQGGFVHSIVPTGAGPGEFGGIGNVSQVTSDSMLILDGRNNRATLVGLDFQPGRMIPTFGALGAIEI